MAQYEHLPVYKQTYSLLVEFHKLIPTYPIKYKFNIGEKLIIFYEKIKIQIRLLKSLEIISKRKYFNLSEKITQILKQSEGWKKKSQN